jgi:hypothetical protein
MIEIPVHKIDNKRPDGSSAKLKRQLVDFSRELGFDSCRIGSCAPPPHISEFRNWLRDGAAGEMSYMERGEEKRCDPQKILPEARSIIVLALNYWQGEARGGRSEGKRSTPNPQPAYAEGFGVAGAHLSRRSLGEGGTFNSEGVLSCS